MCSCSLFFSWPPISTLEAASTSNFLTADITFSSYSSKEIGLLCFFISSSFSVIRVNVDIKIKSKERIGVVIVVVFFLSLKFRVAMRFTAETRGYLKCKISPRLTWMGGRKYGRVRTIFSGPKFLGCIDNQVFLPTVLRYYSQIGGVAMRSRLRPSYVCLFMAVTSRNKSLISRQDEHPVCTSGIYRRHCLSLRW